MIGYEFNIDKEWVEKETYEAQQRIFNTIDKMLDGLIKTLQEIGADR